jgi:tRNA1Val (adenine37-N6)-methyltransferase
MKSSRFPEIQLRSGESIGHFLEGRLKLIQSKKGYRFSIDAVLLSQFVTVRPGDVVIDMGTGCGVIPLILLLTKPLGRAFGLEIQEELAYQAMRNTRLNGLEDRMDVILGDIRHPPVAKGSADVVTCNPPYRKFRSGRINPDPQRAIARHEVLMSLNDMLGTASVLLRKKGRVAFIYPAVRMVDILVRMRRFHLEPKKVRIIYPDLESAAKMILIEATQNGRPGLEIHPPLLGQGDFTI